MTQRPLTQEALKDIFPDNFQLTHYAIRIAQQHIQSGNENLNINQMLREICKHPPDKDMIEKIEV